MRAVLLSLVFVWSMLGAAQAQNAEIESVIGDQIEAFKVDDFDQAFTYASPSIQGIFGSPERFGQMVRNGYPMVWRPDEVRFLELREVAGNLWQRVMITDAEGQVHLLDYQMISLGNAWKINGVQFVKQPGTNA
ncbi:MAG: DUF4864 domain-containing protein [Rhodobacteraceae bacterium]|nr:DUF4864 domain-containing protein [Paracoccaceae bacterium]